MTKWILNFFLYFLSVILTSCFAVIAGILGSWGAIAIGIPAEIGAILGLAVVVSIVFVELFR